MAFRAYSVNGSTSFPDGRLITFSTFRRHDGGAIDMDVSDWGNRGKTGAYFRLALRSAGGTQLGATGQWDQWFQTGRRRLTSSLGFGDYALNGRFYGTTWFNGVLETGIGT